MALRRWKPFLGAFPLIDAAIEASDAGGLLSRDEFRSARSRIVELLCDAADDGEKAEGLCALLDEAMAESLVTLRMVPAEKIQLASGDLVGAVAALMRDHASERVRGLARDVVRGWKAGVGAELAKARAAMDALNGLSTTPPPVDKAVVVPRADSDTKAKKIQEMQQPRPRKTAVVTTSGCVTESCAPFPKKDTAPAADSNAKAKIQEEKPSCPWKKIPEEKLCPRKTTLIANSRRVTESYAPLPNKKAPIVLSSSNAKPSANHGAPAAIPAQQKKTLPIVRSSIAEEEKMIATKRKLEERYQEVEDAKRRRMVQMIKPPRPPP
ncbi:hypothetical protein HU200_033373 [Digitaria exilis]|uniref:TFIIS N-terminal domain-containing protein n=1 Tax=Digitaria exilis TaxID=1010633 RepID=A0A835ENQ4_9POAL|nr:hypothetical protein HU200_033373 [Digitaria exilis]CAB3482962.1 unnamed protein product [Digitaria exilis]